MKKKNLFFTIILVIIFLSCKDVYAFDSSNYKNRGLCGNYEVASLRSDGSIISCGCYSNVDDARIAMYHGASEELVVFTRVYNSRTKQNETKIIDANKALLDLSVNDGDITYYYETSQLNKRKYTYMVNNSNYGTIDGAFLGSDYSTYINGWTAKVMVANFTGWIAQDTYEIVPLTWVKSSSYYDVTNESIIHRLNNRIQNNEYILESLSIGPKPDMLSTGRYYSYDGHYFYKDLKSLLMDYRTGGGSHNRAANKDNEYYNYYQYLSNHTKTNYSSVNIDEYIRNNLGYTKDVYGNKASSGTSRLYGMGTYFYYAQEKLGVNALIALNLGRNESGNGRSKLAINKNNGFGLDAVDSNPIGGAKWFPTFSYNILHLASHWFTYGYSHPRDWRYFGPQFGDKGIGMNVKYASAAYWSETMASLYYQMDRAMGLQDYNTYQLGVVKEQTQAYYKPEANGAYQRYTYPEAEDALVIIGETYSNGELWYKVVSDLNMDNNFNEIYENTDYNSTAGNYNWNSYVYVQASHVKKINKAKNGYTSPNDVGNYQNKNYTYNLYIENGEFKPRVGLSTKDTAYHYDPSLTSKTGSTLLKDRYVIIYSQALENGQPVSYLVSSDYRYSQKEWVSADSIKQVNMPYGKVSVVSDNNTYTLVNYNTVDTMATAISGLYDYAIVPIISSQQVGNDLWYKVPVSLTTNSNVYGYTLASWSDVVKINVSQPVYSNTEPTITAENKELYTGTEFDPKKDVTAYDQEDGDITNKINVTSNNVDTTKKGTYQVTYQVTDSSSSTTTKTITVTVLENNAPEITAEDKVITINTEFNELKDVKANDQEDGDLTKNIKVTENTVNVKKLGTYKVVYEVTDSMNKKTTKEIKVEVVKDREPVINADNKTIVINSEFNPKDNVTVTDPEDGDITNKLEVKTNTVDTTKKGTYDVTYEVVDSSDNKVTKTIKVTVSDFKDADGEFSLEDIKWTDNKFEISGYLIINNVDNTNKEYKLLLVDKNDKEKSYEFGISSWKDNVPYDLGIINGKSYSDSWFKGTFDLSKVPNGDYEVYMTATSNEYKTKQVVDNFFNQSITKRVNTDNKGYSFNVITDIVERPIELQVRNHVYTTSQAPTFRTMINEFEIIEFKDEKLYIQGYSYNYNGTYDNKDSITRKLLVENTNTYEQSVFDVETINGPYKLTSRDNKDKTFAWYEDSIDLKDLSKGTYTINVYTKTKDAEDYGELTDMFKTASGTMEKDGKKYTIKVNKERLNRIEITVE